MHCLDVKLIYRLWLNLGNLSNSYLKDNLSDILVFNLGNVPGFHLIRAKVGGVFKLKLHTTYRNMIIYSSRLDTQNPDVTVQRISTFKHVQAHVLIYLWLRNV